MNINPFDTKGIYKDLLARLTHSVSEYEEGLELSPGDKSMLLGILMSTAAHMDDRSRFVPKYLGRCMQGRSCVGIVCRGGDDFAFALAEACFEAGKRPSEVRELLGESAQDDMGKGIILYWPRIITHDPQGGG